MLGVIDDFDDLEVPANDRRLEKHPPCRRLRSRRNMMTANSMTLYVFSTSSPWMVLVGLRKGVEKRDKISVISIQ